MTREKAIKHLEVIKGDVALVGDIQALDMAISALSENKGEWIPVSERLPEEKLAVLVWCPEYKNIYCAYCVNGSWWIFGAFSQIIPNAVIAWQPLPEPYMKGGE